MALEREARYFAIPQINEVTRVKLEEELGLGSRDLQISNRLQAFAVSTFNDIRDAKAEVVAPILERVSKSNFNQIYYSDPYLEGMAIVFRAYQIQTEYNLLSALQALPDDIQQEIDEIMLQNLPEGGILSILDQLQLPTIPDHQINLKQVVKASDNESLRGYLKAGAGAAYKILENLWPKLKLTDLGSK